MSIVRRSRAQHNQLAEERLSPREMETREMAMSELMKTTGLTAGLIQRLVAQDVAPEAVMEDLGNLLWAKSKAADAHGNALTASTSRTLLAIAGVMCTAASRRMRQELPNGIEKDFPGRTIGEKAALEIFTANREAAPLPPLGIEEMGHIIDSVIAVTVADRMVAKMRS